MVTLGTAAKKKIDDKFSTIIISKKNMEFYRSVTKKIKFCPGQTKLQAFYITCFYVFFSFSEVLSTSITYIINKFRYSGSFVLPLLKL